VLIRRAAAADVADIAALVQRAYGDYVESLGVRPAPLDDDYSARVTEGQTWLAEDEGVAGVIVLVVKSDHLLVDNVAVAPERQGAGVGRELLAHAEAFAESHGLAEVRLYTNAGMRRNIDLYRYLGFEEIDRRKAGHFYRVFFSKRLTGLDRLKA
jgi:ribosomal protein S18 acetylase RimI-like enzyme